MKTRNTWNAVRRRIDEIRAWAGDGLCGNAEIAARLGVSADGLSRMEEEHPELSVALADARKPLLHIAEESLRKLVTGYEYKEKSVTFSPGGNGMPARAESIRVTSRSVPPQIGAINIYLNRFDPYYRNRELENARIGLQERTAEVKERAEERKAKTARLRFLKP